MFLDKSFFFKKKKQIYHIYHVIQKDIMCGSYLVTQTYNTSRAYLWASLPPSFLSPTLVDVDRHRCLSPKHWFNTIECHTVYCGSLVPTVSLWMEYDTTNIRFFETFYPRTRGFLQSFVKFRVLCYLYPKTWFLVTFTHLTKELLLKWNNRYFL